MLLFYHTIYLVVKMFHFLIDKILYFKKEAVSYLLITLLLWIIGVSTPYISGIYIDYLLAGVSTNLFFAFIVAIAAINILQMFIRYFLSITSTKFNQKLAANISNSIYQKIFNSNYNEYVNIDSAYYIDQINKDTYTLVGFFSSNITSFFFQMATIVISAIIVLQADKLLCIIIFSLIPFYVITFVLNQSKIYVSRKSQKEKSNEYFSHCSEQINKFSYIKRNVLNFEMESRFKDAFNNMLSAALHAIRVNYLFTNLNQFVIILAYICIIGIGGYKVRTGSLSIGLFSIINTYFNMIISSISYFIGLASSYQDAKVSFQRIQKIMQSPNEEIGTKLVSHIENVRIHNLSITHGDQVILKNCNFVFSIGKIYGICGHNGGGKTTLLNAIIGLYSGEHTGDIYYDNDKIDQLNMLQIRRQKISYVEQDPVLLNMSVEDYLHFGIDMCQSVTRNQRQLLALWDIDYLLTKELNENGSNLSGGEKQKLSIVRALSKDSFLILLDEPTSALDKNSIEKLMVLLNQRKDQAIILLVSHDHDVLEQCDEIIEISAIQKGFPETMC